MEMTNIQNQLRSGCDTLIHESAQTSEGEPNLAIAQLLLSAAILAQTIGMKPKNFNYAFTSAVTNIRRTDSSVFHSCRISHSIVPSGYGGMRLSHDPCGLNPSWSGCLTLRQF